MLRIEEVVGWKVSEQLKTVHQDARVGIGDGARRFNAIRWQSWKAEKGKMKRLISVKKRKCWEKFCAEKGNKDPWEVIRFARDPCRLKTMMKKLKDNRGQLINGDYEKAAALGCAHRLWKEEGRQLSDVEGQLCDIKGPDNPALKSQMRGSGYNMGDLKIRLLEALSKTSSSSAPGLDGICYRLIKLIRDIGLGQALIDQMAEELSLGRCPYEWQLAKIVFIPKPNRDYTLLRSWRPIHLINCICKLGEKVVADDLQEAGLFHRHQFGSIK